MPELPEVEITRRGLLPGLSGKTVTGVAVRNHSLRYPIPRNLPQLLHGRKLVTIARRGKYLLFDFGAGTLLVHLGMSGSLRLLPANTSAEKHDHFDLIFGTTIVRLRDPRRFGAVLWDEKDINAHPLIAPLGIEPLSPQLTAQWLHEATRNRSAPVKQVLMDSHTIVGIGNIYASESLFRAGINPRTPAQRLSLARCTRLIPAIKSTLEAAIKAGGSSLRDFIHSDGGSGYFQQQYHVYDRTGQPCKVCGAPIRRLIQGQRATFFCPRCQR